MPKKHPVADPLCRVGSLTEYLPLGERIAEEGTAVYRMRDNGGEGAYALSDEKLGEILGRWARETPLAFHFAGADRGEETMLFLFRSLYQASAEQDLVAIVAGIVLPSEAEHVRQCAAAARQSLEEEGRTRGKLRAGLAIENPSAAILADLLAPLFDFFVFDEERMALALGTSVGENVSCPENVRRCLNMTCAAARREGIPVYGLKKA